jgi:hypothetical protein
MKHINCRWSYQDALEDYYCVNDASEYCTDVVDEDKCKDCSQFFSQVDGENKTYEDDCSEVWDDSSN